MSKEIPSTNVQAIAGVSVPAAANRRGNIARPLMKAAMLVGIAALATACTGAPKGVNAAPNTSGSTTPTATAGANGEAYNPAVKCVSRAGTQLTINMACEEAAFPSTLPAAVQSDIKAVDTIGITDGGKYINFVTATKIGPNEDLTVSHGLEGLKGCDAAESYVAAQSPTGGQGFRADLSGFSTHWHDGSLDSPSNGSDTAVAYVSGPGAAEFAQLPDMPVAVNAQLAPGTPLLLLSEQATTGGDAGQHDPSSPYYDQRPVDVIEAVALGPDQHNPANTVYATFGTYTEGQLSAPIEGSSGGALVELNGDGVLLQDISPVTPDNNPGPFGSNFMKEFAPNVTLVQGGSPILSIYGGIGVSIPVNASSSLVPCN